MLRVWPPTFKPVLQQIRLSQVVCWVLTSDWIKLRGSHAIQGSYVTSSKQVCLGPVERATCTTFYFLQQIFATGNNLNCCRTAVWRRPVVKRTTSLFKSLCSNVAKQVARFCCLLYRTLKDKLTDSMASLDKLFGSITIDWSSLRR